MGERDGMIRTSFFIFLSIPSVIENVNVMFLFRFKLNFDRNDFALVQSNVDLETTRFFLLRLYETSGNSKRYKYISLAVNKTNPAVVYYRHT